MQIIAVPPLPVAALRAHVRSLARKHHFLLLLVEWEHPVLQDELVLGAQSAERVHATFANALGENPLFKEWKGELRAVIEDIAREEARRLAPEQGEQDVIVTAVMSEDLDALWPEEWGC